MKVGRSRRTSTTKQMHTFKHIFQNSRLLLAFLFIVALASCTPRLALTQQRDLDLSTVSVVPLVVYYTVPTPPILASPVYNIEHQYTGLGQLRRSWSTAIHTRPYIRH